MEARRAGKASTSLVTPCQHSIGKLRRTDGRTDGRHFYSVVEPEM